MNVRRVPVSFEDHRGVIGDVFPSGAPDCVTLITSARGAVRGNHVHRLSSQHALVVTGRMRVFSRVGDAGEVERRDLGPGDVVLHEPGEAHAYLALDDVVFLAFVDGPRRGEDYEVDTHRVAPLFDPVAELAAAVEAAEPIAR